MVTPGQPTQVYSFEPVKLIIVSTEALKPETRPPALDLKESFLSSFSIVTGSLFETIISFIFSPPFSVLYFYIMNFLRISYSLFDAWLFDAFAC